MISLQVKGKPDLLSSLQNFVSAETVSGLKCDVCKKKADCRKRQCINSLPATLVFHLKRFELNFQTFQHDKVSNKAKTGQGKKGKERRTKLVCNKDLSMTVSCPVKFLSRLVGDLQPSALARVNKQPLKTSRALCSFLVHRKRFKGKEFRLLQKEALSTAPHTCSN